MLKVNYFRSWKMMEVYLRVRYVQNNTSVEQNTQCALCESLLFMSSVLDLHLFFYENLKSMQNLAGKDLGENTILSLCWGKFFWHLHE